LAMNEKGGYTYTTNADSETEVNKSNRYDNSNTQFGNLGVWIPALAGCNVPKDYWGKASTHWLSTQNEDGGWGYHTGRRSSTQNMTIAGFNSLIIVLDQLYAKSTGKYVKFKGISKNQRAIEEMQKIQTSISRGRHWLATKAKPFGEAYTQLGLERLGLASGEKFIGTNDWYRAGAERAMEIPNWEHQSIENISMWLLFLDYGRAPVLINKLKWGGQDSGWDYYFRDMYHVCRFMTNTYEQIYKWQIIDTAATEYDLEDAPFLYISGDSRFWLPQGISEKIKNYVYSGGTIIGHANLGNKVFAMGFKNTYEKLFSELGVTFRKLPPEHPIYSTVFGAGETSFQQHVPIWGLSDGYREMVLLFPVDLAGAWHQSLDQEYVDVFRLVANIRFYGADRYKRLPGRLRPSRLTGYPARPWGTLRVARVLTEVDCGGAPDVWEQMDELMTHFYGVEIDTIQNVRLANINESKAFDLVHIAGQGDHKFSEQELDAIRKYCRSGGYVFVEAIGGDSTFAKSSRGQLEQVFGGSFGLFTEKSKTIRGDFPRGKPLRNLIYSAAARRIGQRNTHPPLYGVTIDGKTRLVLSTLDLSVSGSNQFVRGLRGYDSRSAQKVLRNILLERYSENLQRGKSRPTK